MDDYEYCPDVHSTDLMSKLFLESIAVPVQEIDIEAMEFQNAVEAVLVPPLNEDAARLFTASE